MKINIESHLQDTGVIEDMSETSINIARFGLCFLVENNLVWYLTWLEPLSTPATFT